jgi:hypothetical protein
MWRLGPGTLVISLELHLVENVDNIHIIACQDFSGIFQIHEWAPEWRGEFINFSTKRLKRDPNQFAFGRRKRIQPGVQYGIRESQVKVSHRARHFCVSSGDQPICVSRHESDQTIVLVEVRFSVLVQVEKAAVVQQRAVALRDGLEPGDEIGKFLYVPAADIAHNALCV